MTRKYLPAKAIPMPVPTPHLISENAQTHIELADLAYDIGYDYSTGNFQVVMWRRGHPERRMTAVATNLDQDIVYLVQDAVRAFYPPKETH